MSRDVAHFEVAIKELARATERDRGLRWRLRIASIVERIDSTDRGGQMVLRTINVDRSRLAIIRSEDAQPRLIRSGQSIANACHCHDEFRPANFFDEIPIDARSKIPPA